MNSRRLIARPRSGRRIVAVQTGRLEVVRLAQGNVRFGSKADIAALPINVRYTPESGHRRVRVPRPLCAKSGLMQCSISSNDEGTRDEGGAEHRTVERPSSAWRFPGGRVLCHGVQNRPIKGREFIFQPAAECLDLRAIAAALGTNEMVGAA